MTSGNLIAAIEESLRIARRAPEGVADPVAILWTDPDRQWASLIPLLRPVLSNLYTLGEWNPVTRTGPTIWMKCIVDRTIDDAPPPGLTPILYLPGVGRQTLRAGVECPAHLQPLIELQYRGVVWHQKNGRDWTVEAFLLSELELDMAQDTRTREAMLRALPLLADVDLEGLRGRRLDADDFDLLAVSDPVRDLLRWMAAPEVTRAGMDEGRWESFRNLARHEFDFDPSEEDGIEAAERLLEGKGRWNDAWDRFAEAPHLYQGIAKRLKEPRPRSLLTLERDPARNQSREAELRKDLEALADRAHADVCEAVIALEERHRSRRDSVWARLGESALAMSLEPLARIARSAQSPIGGSSVDAAAGEYTVSGWSCDSALLDALSQVRSGADGDLIAKVARALYAPWADASARHFQKLIASEGRRSEIKEAPVDRETCSVFVDGLRFDLGVRLKELLETRGLRVVSSHRISPLPTVTATGKPVATPRIDAFLAGDDASGFNPVIAQNRQPVVASRMRDELTRLGVLVMIGDEIRSPESEESLGWTEAAEIDALGHKLGTALAKNIDEELDRISDRIVQLTDAGWKVKVVTDHGWLLLPGGLPKVELPKSLVESKWSRCATVRTGSTPEMTSYPWYWNEHVQIASPPGIGAFIAGNEYAHGGVSLQECVLPELFVTRAADATAARITKIEWRGMRCRVSVSTNALKATIDLRLHRAKPDMTLAVSPKEIGSDGEASLVISDDSNEGRAAVVVVLDENGVVLDHAATTIGEH